MWFSVDSNKLMTCESLEPETVVASLQSQMFKNYDSHCFCKRRFFKYRKESMETFETT
jgi:hypothetical protein